MSAHQLSAGSSAIALPRVCLPFHRERVATAPGRRLLRAAGGFEEQRVVARRTQREVQLGEPAGVRVGAAVNMGRADLVGAMRSR